MAFRNHVERVRTAICSSRHLSQDSTPAQSGAPVIRAVGL
jgi:hypothetical protein